MTATGRPGGPFGSDNTGGAAPRPPRVTDAAASEAKAPAPEPASMMGRGIPPEDGRQKENGSSPGRATGKVTGPSNLDRQYAVAVALADREARPTRPGLDPFDPYTRNPGYVTRGDLFSLTTTPRYVDTGRLAE